jgi:hypothetical protein
MGRITSDLPNIKQMKHRFTDRWSMMTKRQKRVAKLQIFVATWVIVTSGLGTVAVFDAASAQIAYVAHVFELGTAYAKQGAVTPSPIVIEVPVIRTEDATKAIVGAAAEGAIKGTNQAIKDNLGKR